ncbi:MAG: 30S ribosomal protein S20 [bacterium]|nr:30S ribosomal protein S20 [bacterium]
MPQTKSAKKALRQESRRKKVNKTIITRVKKAYRATRKKPNLQNLAGFSSVLDQAAKKHKIHKNKASRLKSRLAKLSQKQSVGISSVGKTVSKKSSKRK